jgi:crotonobetainyl-CoA:carnitine CoA-transferase CaiB-like acyl-CoA transferase
MGGLVPAALRGERFEAHPARFVRRDDGGYTAVSGELEAPVLDIEQVQADPHLRARGFVVPDTHPVAGPRPVAAVPWRYDGERPPLGHAPRLGAATEAVLAEAAR